jgi:hypothetical protein
MKIPLFLAAAALAASPPAETTFRSGPARAHLVELYTSEGCSSCPPADAWLSSLKDADGLWRDFVPVEFHVDYWDGLGWPDRLADKSFTARQRAYASSWGSSSVYTPGFVLDGREWRPSGRIPPASDGGGVLEARVAGGRVLVRYARPGDVYVARLGFGLSSSVRAGENSGRELRHDFVVRGLARARLAPKGGVWTAELPLPGPTETGRGGLAVWIAGADGVPAQAVGGFLP